MAASTSSRLMTFLDEAGPGLAVLMRGVSWLGACVGFVPHTFDLASISGMNAGS